MPKLNCAILDDYPQKALEMADWGKLVDEVNIRAYPRHLAVEELVSEVQDCHILIAMRERTLFNSAVFSRLPQLRLLVTSGMQNSAIDLKSAKEYGVVVSGTKSLKEPPTELTWGLILGLARNIYQDNKRFHEEGAWLSPLGVDLHGKTLGILGLGHIGSRVANIAKAFGMDVVAWSQNLTPERVKECGVRLAESKEALLACSDIISVHLRLSDHTHHLLDKSAFELMKRSALLVNTSRAQIINQEAMIQALRSEKIAGAAVDVLEIEPPPIDCPLRGLPNLLVTSHVGYVTRDNYHHYFTEAVENIEAFLAEAPIRELY